MKRLVGVFLDGTGGWDRIVDCGLGIVECRTGVRAERPGWVDRTLADFILVGELCAGHVDVLVKRLGGVLLDGTSGGWGRIVGCGLGLVECGTAPRTELPGCVRYTDFVVVGGLCAGHVDILVWDNGG
jgi:hypothetical protein